MHAIETDNLFKSYGDLKVLLGLNLRVSAGQVYGLLGPNGAGKSTLIHLLLGFLKPSSGTVRVLGTSDLESVRGRLGYLPERLRYHMRYSAREYLRFLGKFSDLGGVALNTRVSRELERVGLSDAADRQLGTFSKGMLQRFGIAQALLAEPDLLVVDEPTSGLDPAGQREVLDLLADLRTQGHTIFLCTHQLAEVEELCDRVGVLARGTLAIEVDVHHLRGPAMSVSMQVSSITPELQQQLCQLSSAVQCSENTVLLRPNNETLQATVLRTLLEHNVTVHSLNAMERPLERLYLQAVRGELADLNEIARQEPAPAPDGTPPAARRPGEGDTLLNELLRRMNGGSASNDEPPPPNSQR